MSGSNTCGWFPPLLGHFHSAGRSRLVYRSDDGRAGKMEAGGRNGAGLKAADSDSPGAGKTPPT